ncbi:hypothetical protein [Niabella hibiscisoli]|uniref:hypothetical protein n=1 Tax=Niabella hibiscisoli TaxID=1825928 RepID=UPI001F113570|nr:hypothetical protein [Niabella hibiscisoli]MCH5719591.1 hypothetical protein [Niabella hibiscisoli]
MNTNVTYPEFGYKAHELNRYIEASGLFSILLNCGEIVHHRPVHVNDFRNWLSSHNIVDLRSAEN